MCGPDPAGDTRPGTLDRDTGPGTPDPRRTAMSLHSLLSVTIGVPNVTETAAYYADFGLTPADDGWFSTATPAGNCGCCPRPSGACSSCGSVPTTRTTWPGPRPAWPPSACRRKKTGPASKQPNPLPEPASSSTS